jgi:hypothetical protein
MKRFVFFVLFIVLSLTLYAQSNTDLQRFVGTWGDEEGVILTLNANGAGILQGEGRSWQLQYLINGTKFIIRIGSYAYVCDYYFSSNGNVLVLDGFNFGRDKIGWWFNRR